MLPAYNNIKNYLRFGFFLLDFLIEAANRLDSVFRIDTYLRRAAFSLTSIDLTILRADLTFVSACTRFKNGTFGISNSF